MKNFIFKEYPSKGVYSEKLDKNKEYNFIILYIIPLEVVSY